MVSAADQLTALDTADFVGAGGVSVRPPGGSSATMGAMTVVQSRPLLRVGPTPEPPVRPLALSALLATAWVVAVGLVLALTLAVIAWFAADSGSFAGSVRIGAIGWLVAQGSGLTVEGTSITAIPLGGCLLAGLLLHRGGRWAGATSAGVSQLSALGAGAAMAASYAAAGALVTIFAGTDGAHPDVARVAIVFFILAAVFGTLGIVRGADLSDDLLSRWPDEVRAAVTGAVAGVCTMLAAGGLLFTVSIGRHFGDAVSLAEGLNAGLVGGVILALVGVAAVPNAVLCAGAFAAGPGFVLGAGTQVAPGGVDLGSLPALPILAAVPRSGGAWWQEALVVLPLLAGAVAGLVALSRFPADGWLAICIRGTSAGVLAGGCFGVMTWLATGGIGPGRMQEIGPDVLPTLVVCLVACGIGGLASGAVRQLLFDVLAARLGGRRRES